MGLHSQPDQGKHSKGLKRKLNLRLKMTPFLLLSVLATLIAAAPERQRHIRAAAGYDSVCAAAEQAYSRAKAAGKSSKIAGVVAAKTFYLQFFNAKINTIVPSCGIAVDSTHSKSVADMAKYFNTATSSNLKVMIPICKAATVAFFNSMIKGSTKVAAAQAYMPFIQKDPKADPGSACFKSQDYISKQLFCHLQDFELIGGGNIFEKKKKNK